MRITAKQNHRSQPRRTGPLRHIASALCSLALLAALPAEARDRYIPYIESLGAKQQRTYVAAAPSGVDSPLETADTAITVPVSVSLSPEGESQLEAMAAEKQGPLSTEETQQTQAVDAELEQFGYDIFSTIASTFAPVDAIPVPPNYRIGPGDTLVVQLYGKRNVEYQLVVTRDGNILVPEYGPVKVSGLSFDEAEELITRGFEERVIGARAVVTMGRLRTIQVRLAGDVLQPGVYTIAGLSTLIDALLTTGGVRETGSLRRIQLVRGGRVARTLDLYDLLLSGRSEEDLYLAHNDTIFVPPLGDIVYVAGDVQRPAIYELAGGETVGDVVNMAGGLLPTASLSASSIERIKSDGYRTLIDFTRAADERSIRAERIRNGDYLRVLPLEDQLEGVVLLSGHVDRPGAYQYRKGMRLSDLVGSPEALLPGVDTDFALLRREDPKTLRTEARYIRLDAVLAAPRSEADVSLQPRDQVFIFKLAEPRAATLEAFVGDLDLQSTENRPATVVETAGSIRHTGRLPLAAGARLTDVVSLAGGAKIDTDSHYGLIARTRYPSREVEVINFSLAAARQAPTTDANPSIIPGDRLYFFATDRPRAALLAGELEALRAQARFGRQEAVVSALGEVGLPGDYPLAKGMRVSDLVCAANGLARRATALKAELSRIEFDNAGENRTEHIPLDSAALLELCLLQRDVERGLASAAEFEPRYSNDLMNPLLEPMDQLTISRKAGWVERATVTLEGEVVRPGVYAIDRGETLCSVLQRAGGTTEDAYSFGAYFTRESVREMQQETIDSLQAQLDDLMVELSLSHSFKNEEKSSHEWAGKQDYLRTIRQLESVEANGRLVIDFDDAIECSERRPLVMQDGDTLTIPQRPDYVQVAGQVYVPTSHLYRDDRDIDDYVEMSGGHTILGQIKHTYVIQANGEVLNLKGSRTSSRIKRKEVMPGARIYVPINVDRMNTTERAQTWVQTLVNSAIIAGIVL